ncbi:precorrin-6Y C5,15-methyltransferase (decarboxylating) subunit CbiT [Pyrobaculum calidifontis]|uniref:Probable cobalt-precorrin-6B C(15)-methyltransferase (decarboxylating) n=1 Tax=Pyrobaculum calidifontis (strain DSM 21063 / JCM 11548 / VA1) TaxID=410359 RepID=CBIT_PYRCJ|nr:precorrin-6Y C5,15-methyltransferase (decarboxylating) subunit CbiT [Pyrobaculum calidifontis]A3MWC5.1 RecName: Full=Probable cobalt-precorrin-6B C(15)-methyltransferase (decarboxylating) [Pyrobaculum calidifontis JCM 11548]ABO08942.1 precorrin-6Y C5,15-methyltransferase (decarboxylating), CbiT subunit [Pyrobaculum calidifontis JCM 11548]
MTWPYATPGIPDELFERAEGVPMTKAEVRSVALSKLRLRRGGVLVDVGCGTGSVSVEAALIMGEGSRVYAVDYDEEALMLTKRNAEKFGVADRVVLVRGKAPEVLAELPKADRYFVGGGGLELPAIIKAAVERMEKGIIVADVVTLESLKAAVEALGELGLDYEVTQIFVARGQRKGRYTVMTALNPVYIITAYA